MIKELVCESCKNFTNLGIFQFLFGSLKTFGHFDVDITTNHKIYYEENGELLSSLGHGVFYEFSFLWFVHVWFWFQFALTILVFSLSKLISPWTFAREFFQIPFCSSHTIFLYGSCKVCPGFGFHYKIMNHQVFYPKSTWKT